jgi:hypothetical protein
MPRLSVRNVIRCLCQTDDCLERNYIVWPLEDHTWIHIRIDGCLVTNEPEKRSDCLILYSPEMTAKTWVFIIEVKKQNYNMTDVVNKLQISKDMFDTLKDDLLENGITKEMLITLLATSQPSYACIEQLLLSLRNIRKSSYQIIPTLCAKKKTNLFIRVSLSHGFKIGSANNKMLIRFLQSGNNIQTLISAN